MITFRDMVYTESDLLKLNGIALVALYNGIVGEIARLGTPDVALKPVNKFSDKGVAVKRTWGALQAYALAVSPATSPTVDEIRTTITNPEVEITPKRSDETGKELEALTGVVEPKEEVAQPAPEKPPEPSVEETDAPKGRKPRVPRFVFPVKTTIKDCRPGTARAKAVAILSRPEGATFEEVAKATGWDKFKKCYEGIRILHFYLGYGMRQDDQGRIYLRTK